jgi:hypothetical protein
MRIIAEEARQGKAENGVKVFATVANLRQYIYATFGTLKRVAGKP